MYWTWTGTIKCLIFNMSREVNTKLCLFQYDGNQELTHICVPEKKIKILYQTLWLSKIEQSQKKETECMKVFWEKNPAGIPFLFIMIMFKKYCSMNVYVKEGSITSFCLLGTNLSILYFAPT